MLRPTRANPQTPSQAFQTTLTVHLAFVASIVIYVLVGEVMRWSNREFAGGGYGPDWIGDNLTWLRLGVLAYAAANAAPLLLIYNRDWYRDKIIAKSDKEPVIALSGALMTSHIAKVATVVSVAVIGLVLYVLTSERLDLYLFNGIALAGLLLIWPKRSEWDSAFRRHALTNPGIPADPWRVAG
jgi:hypothetical protein